MSGSSGRLRVAVVGASGIGRQHVRAWQRARLAADLAGVEVAALSSTSLRSGALGVARVVADWRELVDDPAIDLIDVCLPDDLHAEVVTAALGAGKHVLCEKPLGRDTAEGTRLSALAGARGAFVPFVYRAVPAVARARAMVADGVLGEVIELRGHYLQSWLLETAGPVWRTDPTRGTGVLGDLGTHLLDACGWVCPSAATVSAVAAVPGQDLQRRAAWSAGFAGGAVGSFVVSRTAPGHVNDLMIEISGSEGALRVCVERPDRLLWSRPGRGTEVVGAGDMTAGDWLAGWRPRGVELGWTEPFVSVVSDVAAAVLGLPTADAPATFADAVRVDTALDLVRAVVAR